MIPFITAKHQGPTRTGPVLLIVIHTMEAKEKPKTARNVALWFAGPQAPMASAHYCIDADETFQCVKEDVVAWAAPGGNRDGVHLEHAGYASQSAVNWSDEYSMKMLARSAALAAELVKRYDIPIVKLSPEDLKDRAVKGFCGHVDLTQGRMGGHGHTDPGPFFPWDVYLLMVAQSLGDTDPGAPPSEGGEGEA
jgi:N-acetyl-anhydromuramyl-L-alanine amidase AmpD